MLRFVFSHPNQVGFAAGGTLILWALLDAALVGVDATPDLPPFYYPNYRSRGVGLPFTSEVQAYIETSQNPPSCAASDVAVFVHDDRPHGLGSIVHCATAALAHALNSGKVLVFSATAGGMMTGGSYCEDARNLSCFFAPPSTTCADVAPPPSAVLLDGCLASLRTTIPDAFRPQAPPAPAGNFAHRPHPPEIFSPPHPPEMCPPPAPARNFLAARSGL